MANSFEGTKTHKYRLRQKQLRDDVSEFRPHWKEISEYMLPRKGRYLSGENSKEANDGTKMHQKILNGSAVDALRIIAAGMQGGLTSPSRPWFVLALPDEEMMEYAPVKEWLHQVRGTLLNIFARSNFYVSVHSMYRELAAFGTSAMLTEEDFKTTIRCRPFTVGEFTLALNSKYRPDSLYRQFSCTARQLVEKFGEEAVSDSVKQSVGSNNGERRYEVIHAIQPRGDMEPGKQDFSGMPFESVYFEPSSDPDKVLREGGYGTIPFVAPRWDVTATDTYGECPGMDALGDVKQLQKMEEKKLKALDKMVDPPMTADNTLKNKPKSIIAGGVTYADLAAGAKGFIPTYQINPDMQNLAFEIDRVETRIRRFFFNDLFLAIINQEKTMTATEVARRHEEKLMVLGPVLERLQAEMLDPIIERAYNIMLELDLMPPIPPELEGAELKIEYVSLLAQAQKMVGTASIEQLAGFTGNLAGISPNVIDKLNLDEAVDQYADMVGVPPKIVRTDDEVAKVRQQRAAAEQAAQQQEQAMQAAQGAKLMSETKLDENSALDSLRETLGR